MKQGCLAFVWIFLVVGILAWSFGQEEKPSEKSKAQSKATAQPKAKAKAKAPPKPKGTALVPVGKVKSWGDDFCQFDLPDAVTGAGGATWIAALAWDGEKDSLVLAREGDSGFETESTLASGILHAPSLAVSGDDLWCFWGETDPDDETVDLRGVQIGNNGKVKGRTVTLADTDAAEAFVDSGTDAKGRPWIAWQSFRAGEADIFARFFDPDSGEWSEEIAVATERGGDWEPSLAFDGEGNAWVLYDSSRGNEFDLHLARVTDAGAVREFPIGHSDRYEARGSIAATAEGDGFWIAGERGRVRWGLDARGHDNTTGLNAQKDILFGRFSIAKGNFTEIPLGPAGQLGAPVNLPVVGVGKGGDPWVAYRYFERVLWRVGLTSYRADSGTWSSRRRLEGSSYGQDRESVFLPVTKGKGDIRLCWPSDLRKTKKHELSAIHLAALPAAAGLPAADPAGEPRDLGGEPFAPSQNTPERPADDRHTWEIGGKEYGLYWGDLHRHTDVSNCRTGFDGTIVEHFRYACDIAKLDFLGTSDHTDVGKFYHPYEWWHNQRMHDALHSPGRFNSIYVYEREQRWPWGHRNVIFAERGGPVVYINRSLYRESPWQESLPVKPGVDEIVPEELWDILRRYDKPVALISHTGATRMGTDWSKYERIDYETENLVEIFQGARVSYEAAGAPQPTVGLKPGEKYTINGDPDLAPGDPPATIDDFGIYKMGTYQTALELGRRLGVFTSSDHIAQHCSYGGVFCEDFTREGIIEGFDARRTIAATDKIYLNFTCNGEPLGSFFETDEDVSLWFRVDGTAPIRRVTIIRNEEDWKTFDAIDGTTFEEELADEAMIEGENRYYVRVEQVDGNMAWSSPVWVTRK